MIKAFIKLRAKQTYRELCEIGLMRSIFVLMLLCFLLVTMFLAVQEDKITSYIIAGFLFVFLLIHVKRKDKVFLQTRFSNHKYIFQVEYLLLAFPLIISLLLNYKWQQLIILILGGFAISYMNYIPEKRSLNTKLQKFIPNEMYEWKAGSRKLMFIVVPFWTVGLFTSFFIGSVPVTIFVIGISLLGLYETCEPYQMIIASEKSPRKFVNRKILLHTWLFTVISMPLVVAFIAFHVEYWYIAVVEYLVFISLHIYFILIKCAYYQSNKKPAPAQIMNILGAISLIIPLFLPVIWLFSIIFYSNSLKTLNYYLDDFH